MSLGPPPVEVQRFHQRLSIGLAAALVLLVVLWLIKLLLPWLLLAAGLASVGYLWQRQRVAQRRLYTCFYDCLQRQQGKISALDFAIAAQIPGPQARAFLDARARDFLADFEPMATGDIVYTFGYRLATPVHSLPKLRD
ncbi:MAG: hypothetical protein ACFBSG_03490 [Leptolyngbyaceae cyanobacterium]